MRSAEPNRVGGRYFLVVTRPDPHMTRVIDNLDEVRGRALTKHVEEGVLLPLLVKQDPTAAERNDAAEPFELLLLALEQLRDACG